MRYLLLVTLFLFGCGASYESTRVATEIHQEPKLSAHDKVEKLRKEAESRGLHWKVLCLSWITDPNEKAFLAVAWHKGEEENEYVDRWMAEGTTQGDAALALFYSIQGAPTHPKREHKVEAPKKEKRRICPQTLADTSNAEPCEKCEIIEEEK